MILLFLKNRNMFKMVSVVLQVLVYYKEEKECCWNNNKNKNNYNTAIKMSVMYGKMTQECVKIFHRADISASKIQKSETEAL